MKEKIKLKKIDSLIIFFIGLFAFYIVLLCWYPYTHPRSSMNQPECYLVEENIRCGTGYYEHKLWCPSWLNLDLKECCRGKDYLLKGVYGDYTCQHIIEGVD